MNTQRVGNASVVVQRHHLLLIRQALLMLVDVIEKIIVITPTTASLRHEWRVKQNSSSPIGGERQPQQ